MTHASHIHCFYLYPAGSTADIETANKAVIAALESRCRIQSNLTLSVSGSPYKPVPCPHEQPGISTFALLVFVGHIEHDAQLMNSCAKVIGSVLGMAFGTKPFEVFTTEKALVRPVVV